MMLFRLSQYKQQAAEQYFVDHKASHLVCSTSTDLLGEFLRGAQDLAEAGLEWHADA